ncbi:MAG: FxsA family protein [Actinomycetota bacterium]|nr:FxsA family protein [Actinomycetota bacterium]
MRRVSLLLAATFVALPLAELYTLVQVGHLVGALPAVALLLGVSVLGAFVVRREGARAWVAFRRALAQGRVPSRETADGAVVLIGGALLVTPGFLTDVLGLALLSPLGRPQVRRLLTGWLARRLVFSQRASRRRADPPPYKSQTALSGGEERGLGRE